MKERRGHRKPKRRRSKEVEERNSVRREDSSGMDPSTFKATQGFWDPTDSSHVQAVKKALHLSEVPDRILCRDEEQGKVINFCKACIMEQRAGSIYICGCPGTGKSLTMEKVKSLCASWSKQAGTMHPEMIAINCTSLTDPKQIYLRVLQSLKSSHVNDESNNSKDLVMKELKHLMCHSAPSNASSKRMLLLILDEMDYLITRDQSVLYDLFRFPTLSNSRLVLIGIANAFDLTDRLLPKLRSMNCKVDAVTFPPYSKDQILSVLLQRLQGLGYCVFQPAALELCARKVAAATGDMRKALHVCRSAVELVEAEAGATKSEDDSERGMESSSIGGAQHSSNAKTEQISQKEASLVQIDVMARVLSRAFRSPVVETIQSLPRHQQMVLCAAVRNFRRGKKDSNVGELNTAYLEFCKLTGMQPLTPPEFSSVCQVLADQALLSLGISREERLRRVTLKVDQEDVTFALQGVRFFRFCL
ncbi:unnamed protein product [Calypogeia fissa]